MKAIGYLNESDFLSDDDWFASHNFLEKRFTIRVCKYVDRISGLKHFYKTRFAGEEL